MAEECSHSSTVPGQTIGPLWVIGWLFTIAFAKLVWWKAIIALVIWPYYLGVAFR